MKFVPMVVTRSIGRKILQTKKASPHIYFVVGVAGVIGATVLACRATLKLEETVNEIDEDLKEVKTMKDDVGSKKYNDDDHYKDMLYVYAKSTGKIVRLYAPAAIVGGISLAALTGSHVQLTRRNSALTFTLAAVTKAYDEYRIRVADVVGKDLEENLYHNVTDVNVDGTGKNQVVTKTVDPNGLSPYARFFDEYSVHFVKDAELNKIFLQLQQNYANHLLRARGHVFLNEVYDSLGLERTQAGQVVGWVMGGSGDNFIDFGFSDGNDSRFFNGLERSVLLDFNVDGVVYDLI